MNHHLVLIYRSLLQDIINGRKTMECRLGQEGHTPYNSVEPGDLIWLKQVGGPVRAVATVRKVRYFNKLTPYIIKLIRKEWNSKIRAPAAFWQAHRNASVGTLIWFDDICPLKPFRIVKRDRRAWVLLRSPPIPGETL